MNYIRLTCGLWDKGKLIPSDSDLGKYINDVNKDWYSSIYYYNDSHLETFKKTGTISGITDVVTDKLVFDFDDSNIDNARTDAITLIQRLKDKKFDPKAIQTYWSGNKGFSVIVDVDAQLTPRQLRKLCYEQLGEGLRTLDSKVYNAARVFRIPFTRHNVSGLYKAPISEEMLLKANLNEIKNYSSSLDNVDGSMEYTVSHIDPTIIPEDKETKYTSTGYKNDFTMKPKDWRNCKWSLLQGNFESGNRNQSLIVIAATCKALGYDKETCYYMCKSALKKQAARTQTEEFSKEELWDNVVSVVYNPTWVGGQYSCRKDGWLHDYCEALGEHKCKREDETLTVEPNEVYSLFTEYVDNYDKNVLFTGIESLDKKVKLMVGTSNAFVAPPGVGKSSMALEILNHNSNKGIKSIFFSYDMFHSALYMRMLQKHTGLTQDQIYEIFKHDEKEKARIKSVIEQEYKNVRFCFKSGQTPEQIEDTIEDTEQKIGDKVKLIIVDYNELVVSSASDSTAASAQTAQKLRQIANEKAVCALTLLQPSKNFSSPADEITNYNAAKGSSTITQSLTLMLGLARPGFNPRNPETDKYFNITCLKNRNGPLFSLDYTWNGITGKIGEMDDEHRVELKEIRRIREELKKNNSSEWE